MHPEFPAKTDQADIRPGKILNPFHRHKELGTFLYGNCGKQPPPCRGTISALMTSSDNLRRRLTSAGVTAISSVSKGRMGRSLVIVLTFRFWGYDGD